MTFTIIPFETWHLEVLEHQPSQIDAYAFVEFGNHMALANDLAFTAVTDRVVGCAGLIPMYEGTDLAWANLSVCGPAVFLKIHRAIERFLANRKSRRTEMWVRADFEEALRWARLLGFEWEGQMRFVDPARHDLELYARSNDG